MSADLAREAESVLRNADLLYTPADIDDAFDRMGAEIAEALGDSNPLMLSLMIGGMIPAARLLARISFPLEVDYIHATRYRGGITGDDLEWRARPASSLRDRVVLIVDDILDEGLTLSAVLDYCRGEGAERVHTAVLLEKDHDRKPAIQHADFTGLVVDDRYVFGCGMDYKGYLRNAAGIYAVKGE